MLSTGFERADGLALRPNGLRSRLFAVVAQTVRTCAESIRVPDFFRNLLAKPMGLTREPTCNRSRPPPFI
jgi:hypothetical protein